MDLSEKEKEKELLAHATEHLLKSELLNGWTQEDINTLNDLWLRLWIYAKQMRPNEDFVVFRRRGLM